MANNYNKIKCVSIRNNNFSYCWKPYIISKNVKYDKQIEGISTYIRLFYSGNIGHLLWDDLYSIYLSFLKLKLKYEPFNIIISKYNNRWRNNWMTNIYEVFSRNKLTYEMDMINEVYLIKTLVVGIAHQCQRCINNDYSIPGGKFYRATLWMRKRMYYTYNISKCYDKYGIVVHNKRYSKNEINILEQIINEFNKTYRIKYIYWNLIKNFKKQLNILSCTSIYISGPGTGLLNFPFISDPGIVINLGGLYRGCPSYMEQYIQEGSPHFISLYYPSNKRIYGIKKDEMIKLVRKALNILHNFSAFKKHHKFNLNIEGKIFHELNIKYPQIMNKFLSDTDWANNKIGIWAERLIYFPYCFNLSYVVRIVKLESKKYIKQLGCNISDSKTLCNNK